MLSLLRKAILGSGISLPRDYPADADLDVCAKVGDAGSVGTTTQKAAPRQPRRCVHSKFDDRKTGHVP
jgi:hypothetical protein